MKDPDIVATLGPASWELAVALRDAGATAFRLNASHMSAADVASRASDLLARLPETRLIIDLQGAKMRLGQFAARRVRRGETLRFSLQESVSAVPLPHPEVFLAAAAGETLTCDDGRLQFRVETPHPALLETTVLEGGLLRPRKGVNILDHPVLLSDLCSADLACVLATAGFPEVAYAFSFLRNGAEVAWVKARAPGCAVVGKIERREAVDNLHAIAGSVDGLWVCRGDLGAQLGAAGMARWIASLRPEALPVPVLMAGQVLEHLTAHPEPTRSEVCHLFDLVRRGYAGFVLSDETAVGADPVRAVSAMRSLLGAFRREWTG